jgi:TrmH family RNA methyltransferase
VLLLDNLQDPGNVGTLLRTAAALGVQHAVLGEGTAFAWSPKVLRAGQGAHFSINIVEGVALATFLEGYHGNTLALVAAGEGAVPLAHAPFSEPFALMVGNEGQGLQPGLLARASHRVHIPMAGKVESLNAAAAGAIALYEWSRRCA